MKITRKDVFLSTYDLRDKDDDGELRMGTKSSFNLKK